MNAHLSYAGTGDHTTSYYAASANTRRLRPAVQGEHMFDVCVVGAGYSGLSTALHLAERGHNVAIVEGARIGWGASGRNGGQVVNGLNALALAQGLQLGMRVSEAMQHLIESSRG